MKIDGANSVASYLAGLDPQDRKVIDFMRDKIKKVIPKGYVESFNRGMLGREIPLSVYPDTYNKQPIGLVGYAKQKHYYALYLMVIYTGNIPSSPSRVTLEKGFARIGKKPNMGKCCIRFKKIEDMPRDEIQQIIKDRTVEKYIELYESERHGAKKK